MKSITLHFSPLEDKASRKFQGEFERLYIKVREKEQRLYSDEDLRKLPHATIHAKVLSDTFKNTGHRFPYLKWVVEMDGSPIKYQLPSGQT